MKHRKIVLLMMLLALLLAPAACADTAIGTRMEVANCKQYVTLRLEPDTHAEELARLALGEQVTMLDGQAVNGFCLVGSEQGQGYVLLDYLEPLPGEADEAVSIDRSLTQAQRADVNLFLSNFTECGFASERGCFDADDDQAAVDFAIGHIWFNQPDKLEWVEDGEYNVRLAAETIDSVCEKYLGYAPVDKTSGAYDLKDGYYRWTETGGHVNEGFAQITSISALSENRYLVYFECYGAGEDWDNDCMQWSLEQAREQYGLYGSGMAVFCADDLSDRSTFELLRYAFARTRE